MKILILFFLIVSIKVQAKTCKFNSWDIAYGQLGNDLQKLFGEIGPIEPTSPGEGRVQCPSLEKFIGSYTSTVSTCSDIKISIENGINLKIDNLRDFYAINGGEYIFNSSTYSPYLILKTKQEENTIIEKWVNLNGEQIASYSLTLEADQLSIVLLSPVSNFKCSFKKL